MPISNSVLKTILWVVLVLVVVLGARWFVLQYKSDGAKDQKVTNITNFEECEKAGNPVMKSLPRQCQYAGQVFIEGDSRAVGKDKDEHGCIGSAGYSWNAEREQCVRPWELPQMIEAENAVRSEWAKKYNKPQEGVTVKVTKLEGTYVAGSLSFSSKGDAPGGLFLAYKDQGIWRMVYDGNGSVDCETLKSKYGFPDLVLFPQFCD